MALKYNAYTYGEARRKQEKAALALKKFEDKHIGKNVTRDKKRLERLNDSIEGNTPFFSKTFWFFLILCAVYVAVMMIMGPITFSKNPSLHQRIMGILNSPLFFLPESMKAWEFDVNWILNSSIPKFGIGIFSFLLNVIYFPIKLIFTLVYVVLIIVMMFVLYLLPYFLALVTLKLLFRLLVKVFSQPLNKKADKLSASIKSRETYSWKTSPEYKALVKAYDDATKELNDLVRYGVQETYKPSPAPAPTSTSSEQEEKQKRWRQEEEERKRKEEERKKDNTYYYIGYEIDYQVSNVRNVNGALGYHDVCDVDATITFTYKNHKGKERTVKKLYKNNFCYPVNGGDVEQAVVGKYRSLMNTYDPYFDNY